jgi:hypothetical protein
LIGFGNAIGKQERARAGGRRRLVVRSFAVFSVFCVCLSLMLFVCSFSGPSQASVTVNSGNVVGTNKLSLGFQLGSEWKTWSDSSARRELAQNVCFKLVRVFGDISSTQPRLMPCASWNEAAKTGTWDWVNVDSLVQRVARARSCNSEEAVRKTCHELRAQSTRGA